MGQSPSKTTPLITLETIWSKYDKVEPGSFLGRGGFGEAFKVRAKLGVSRTLLDHPERPDVFVIKIVDMKTALAGCCDDDHRRKIEHEMLMEANVWANLSNSHPHIVKYFGCPFACNFVVMELEYADGGDLNGFLQQSAKQGRALSKSTKKSWCHQLLLALQTLHRLDIIHRDISASNILLFGGKSEAATLKLTDFGLARLDLSQEALPSQYNLNTRPVNPPYAPPEYLIGNQRSKQSDIWSLGVVFYFIESLMLPFQGKGMEVLFNIQNYYENDGQQPQLFQTAEARCCGTLISVISRMMRPKAEFRPACVDLIIEDPFFWPEQAIPIVSFKQDRKTLAVHKDAFFEIEKFAPETSKLPAIVISICGSYRSGKSLLMSMCVRVLELMEQLEFFNESELTDELTRFTNLVDRLEQDDRPLMEFRAKSGPMATTSGIFLFPRPFRLTIRGQRVAVYLMDTEGTGSRTDAIENVKNRDYRVLILSAILSSIQLYNVMGQIREGDIADISQFSMFLETLAKKTDDVPPDGKLLQSLTFLLRDFEGYNPDLNEDAWFGAASGRAYIGQNSAGMSKLEPFFDRLEFYAMPRPNSKRAVDKPAFDGKLKVKDLNGDYQFVSEAAKLVKWLLLSATPLRRGRMGNLALDDIAALLKKYVVQMNRNPDSLLPMCEAIARLEHDRAIKKWFAKYATGLALSENNVQKVVGFEWLEANSCGRRLSEKFSNVHNALLEKVVQGLRNEPLAMRKAFVQESVAILTAKISRHYEEWQNYHSKYERLAHAGSMIPALPAMPFLGAVSVCTDRNAPVLMRITAGIATGALAIPSLPFIGVSYGLQKLLPKFARKPSTRRALESQTVENLFKGAHTA